MILNSQRVKVQVKVVVLLGLFKSYLSQEAASKQSEETVSLALFCIEGAKSLTYASRRVANDKIYLCIML